MVNLSHKVRLAGQGEDFRFASFAQQGARFQALQRPVKPLRTSTKPIAASTVTSRWPRSSLVIVGALIHAWRGKKRLQSLVAVVSSAYSRVNSNSGRKKGSKGLSSGRENAICCNPSIRIAISLSGHSVTEICIDSRQSSETRESSSHLCTLRVPELILKSIRHL